MLALCHRMRFAAAAIAVAITACNGQVGDGPSGGDDEAPESALTGTHDDTAQRLAVTYSEAVIVEPNDAYAETCTGVVVAPRVVLTAAHCVAFVSSTSWRVTAPHATGGVETRTARDGEPMDAAFMNASRADYIQRGLRDVGVIYLDAPFTNVKAATVGRDSFTVAKDAPPTYVSSVGRSAKGLEAGLALSPVATLEASGGSSASFTYATARVTADLESGGPLFVEGSHKLVAVHARVVTETAAETELWSRLDGEVYTWLTQKVSSHGGWIAPSPP